MTIEPQARSSFRRGLFNALLVLTSALLTVVALLIPLLPDSNEASVREGQVAMRDYRASQPKTFESQVLIEQRKEAAARAVVPIYTLPDTRVARQQLESLQNALAYITSVRADTYATAQQKLDDLAALDDIELSQETANAILSLPDAHWQEVQRESLAVLERAMSSVIRTDNLEDVRTRLPSLVSLSLTVDQAEVVAELAAAFIAPNSQYSESLTEAARQTARDSVAPVTRSFVEGQTVVSRGQVLTAADVEALQQLGLIGTGQRWQDYVSASFLAVLLVLFLFFYLRREHGQVARDSRRVALVSILFLSTLLIARLVIPYHTVIPYLFPLAAYSLIVAALFGVRLALVTCLPLSILVAYGLPNALDLTFYYMVGSLFGVLALGRARRMASFLWAGAAIAVSGFIVILVYRLPLPTTDVVGLATLAGAALLNGIASTSVTILLHFLLAQFLGLITPMHLVELTRPDHPLLRLFLREAPGTYQHSLMVANLAEQAAERIGADPLLTRAGALYHDVGKSANPAFFIENQVAGFPNPHDAISPLESARVIVQHVLDGVELGRKYHLPKRILDFITEHHGGMLASYQYYEAVKAAGGNENKVDAESFRYPGPRPQSRETAILMLADGIEARVRAERPTDEKELYRLIKGVINDRLVKGQLDDTNLTLRDLNVIADSFAITLRGTYHPRLQYPNLDAAISEPPTTPTLRKPQTVMESPAVADAVRASKD